MHEITQTAYEKLQSSSFESPGDSDSYSRFNMATKAEVNYHLDRVVSRASQVSKCLTTATGLFVGRTGTDTGCQIRELELLVFSKIKN